jgi:SulP family sulfate permease
MTLKKDITSALTVSFLTIAAGAAFGVWTGVGSSLGILSMVVASIMGVFFGGVSVKTSGPTGPTAGLMYTGILMITAAGYSIQAYWFVLMISAVIIFILSYFPVEKLLNHIPYVSIAVFVNGMSFFILHKQLLKVIDFSSLEVSSHIWETSIVFGAVILLFLWPKISKIIRFLPGSSIFSGSLFVMFIGSAANYVLAPDVNSISIDEIVLSNLMTHITSIFIAPEISLYLATLLVFKTVFILFLVTTITAKALDKNANFSSELKNQGVANFAVALIGGIPVTIGFIRTKLLQRSGGSSLLAGILTGVFVLLIAVYMSDALELIPSSVFVGILIKAGLSSFDWQVFTDYKKGNGSLVAILFVLTGTMLVLWQDLAFIFIGSICVWYLINRIPFLKEKCIDIKTCPCAG